ncbi:hypothetical protein [Streptomyces flaveolus]|uniref:hypothetical protein n=1 Tax=Streptomyces flaveolus TaxID=67297 RepID=UPI0036FA4248
MRTIRGALLLFFLRRHQVTEGIRLILAGGPRRPRALRHDVGSLRLARLVPRTPHRSTTHQPGTGRVSAQNRTQSPGHQHRGVQALHPKDPRDLHQRGPTRLSLHIVRPTRLDPHRQTQQTTRLREQRTKNLRRHLRQLRRQLPHPVLSRLPTLRLTRRPRTRRRDLRPLRQHLGREPPRTRLITTSQPLRHLSQSSLLNRQQRHRRRIITHDHGRPQNLNRPLPPIPRHLLHTRTTAQHQIHRLLDSEHPRPPRRQKIRGTLRQTHPSSIDDISLDRPLTLVPRHLPRTSTTPHLHIRRLLDAGRHRPPRRQNIRHTRRRTHPNGIGFEQRPGTAGALRLRHHHTRHTGDITRSRPLPRNPRRTRRHPLRSTSRLLGRLRLRRLPGRLSRRLLGRLRLRRLLGRLSRRLLERARLHVPRSAESYLFKLIDDFLRHSRCRGRSSEGSQISADRNLYSINVYCPLSRDGIPVERPPLSYQLRPVVLDGFQALLIRPPVVCAARGFPFSRLDLVTVEPGVLVQNVVQHLVHQRRLFTGQSSQPPAERDEHTVDCQPRVFGDLFAAPVRMRGRVHLDRGGVLHIGPLIRSGGKETFLHRYQPITLRQVKCMQSVVQRLLDERIFRATQMEHACTQRDLFTARNQDPRFKIQTFPIGVVLEVLLDGLSVLPVTP